MICVALNLFLSLILSRVIGIGGIALATSISEITLFFFLLNSLKRKFEVRIEGIYQLLLVGGCISLVTIPFFLYLFGHLFRIENEFVNLTLSLLSGVTFYLFVAYTLGVQESRRLISLLLRRDSESQ
jgi:putative peptidoglycan lipid II flippase